MCELVALTRCCKLVSFFTFNICCFINNFYVSLASMEFTKF